MAVNVRYAFLWDVMRPALINSRTFELAEVMFFLHLQDKLLVARETLHYVATGRQKIEAEIDVTEIVMNTKLHVVTFRKTVIFIWK